jgi:hypothetical protein
VDSYSLAPRVVVASSKCHDLSFAHQTHIDRYTYSAVQHRVSESRSAEGCRRGGSRGAAQQGELLWCWAVKKYWYYAQERGEEGKKWAAGREKSDATRAPPPHTSEHDLGRTTSGRARTSTQGRSSLASCVAYTHGLDTGR